MSANQPKRRRLWWDLLRVSVTVGALFWVFSQITWKDRLILEGGAGVVWGWQQTEPSGRRVLAADGGHRFPIPADAQHTTFVPGFWTLLRGVNLWILVPVLLVTSPVAVMMMAKRWQWLLRTHDLDPGFLDAVRLTWIGVLTNNVLPGATGGDLVKGVCIYRRAPGKRLAAVMTVLVDRVVGLVALVLVGALAILSQSGRPEFAGPSKFLLGTLLAVLVGGIIFFSSRIRRLLRVSELLARLPLSSQLQKVDASVFHYRRHVVVLGQTVAISLLMHFWTISCVYLAGVALGLPVACTDYFVFLPVIWTGSAFFPSIGGLGVMEGLFQQLFSLPGVGATPSSAVALCILYRIMMLVGSMPGALPAYQEAARYRTIAAGSGEAADPSGQGGECDPLVGDLEAAC